MKTTKSNVIISLNFVLTIPESETLESGIVKTKFKLNMALPFVVFIFRFIVKLRLPQSESIASSIFIGNSRKGKGNEE